MNPIILETMNDIINQVDAREWKRVNDHRERVVKKMKNQSQKIENMQDDWYVATHKIAEENSELHKEIKRLKKSHAETCSYWRIKVMSVEEENKCLKDRCRNFENLVKEYEQRNNELQVKNYDLEVAIQERDDENEKLKKERDEYLENWKSTTRKYVAVTTRGQRLNLIDK
jgi:chromosome segregation ATPase